MAILAQTGETHDFTGFVFTEDANFSGATFSGDADFFTATFTQEANFNDAKFNRDTDYSHATFTANANFDRAKFTAGASFNDTTFNADARFDLATFTEDANFASAAFTGNADFSGAKFTADAEFSGTEFTAWASFRSAKFYGETSFDCADFTGDAFFVGVEFTKLARFNQARFNGEANFRITKFAEHARFLEAHFAGSAQFGGVKFARDANFTVATFTKGLSLGGATFGGVADFTQARFEQPTEVLFSCVNQKTEGLKARLLGCLLDGVRFEDVHWHRPGGRLILQDELDLSKKEPRVRHELVADPYRRLVINFEKSRQYELAEECIMGEMEIRRRNPRSFVCGGWPPAERFYRKHAWARWLGERASMLNAFRWLSNYGTSYLRPFWRIVALVLLIFPFLFGLFGLQRADLLATAGDNVPLISWGNALASPDRLNQLWRTYESMLRTTIQTATLQRNPYAVPATGAGQWVQVAMVLTMPGLLALFLFALRRRFRR